MKKLQNIWAILLLISVQYCSCEFEEYESINVARAECGISNCSCSYFSQTYIEYTCGFEYVIKVYKSKPWVQIQCLGKNPEWDLQVIPKLNLGSKNLQLLYCPFPRNSFVPLLDKINMTVGSESMSKYMTTKGIILTKEQVAGLENVTVLDLSYSNLDGIQDNTFQDFHNLLSLNLERNKIKLTENLLNGTNLKYLDLSNNPNIELKRSFFKHSPRLEKLLLMNCSVTTLESDVFADIPNLKLLELRHNAIKKIPPNLFHALQNLENLSLLSNNLDALDPNLFQYNTKLKSVMLTNNKIPDGILTNLSNLDMVLLENCELKNISINTFKGCSKLTKIQLSINNLEVVPSGVFEDTINLEKLELDRNFISHIEDEAFHNLKFLNRLLLNNNSIKSINEKVFMDLISIEYIDLGRNRLEYIHPHAFENCIKLKNINLSFNKLTFVDDYFGMRTPFTALANLATIDLTNNSIRELPDELFNLAKLQRLNLRNNKIQRLMPNITHLPTIKLQISLENNQISEVKLDLAEKFVKTKLQNLVALSYNAYYIEVNINNNPIKCDCALYELATYFSNSGEPAVKALIKIDGKSLTCAEPDDYRGIPVLNVLPTQVHCLADQSYCPEHCICYEKPAEELLIVDCSNKDLRYTPALSDNLKNVKRFKYIEVSLENNSLIDFNFTRGYESVNKLRLSNNHLNKISWIPPSIKELHLDGNKLQELNADIISQLNGSNTLQKLSLDKNEWACTCKSVRLAKFLKQKDKIILRKVTCSDGENNFMMTEQDLCRPNSSLIVFVSVFILTFLAASATIFAFYYKYKYEVKVWLYAHKIFLSWVTEEELDCDKIYDAFISYHHKDEPFVVDKLVPCLESEPNPYKLCIHYRDFIAGETIANQIATSVANSKRTIVLLSENFLKSSWGKMEFRTAHETAMREKRTRVIMILYEDIDLEGEIYDELRAYLNTHTYIKWGDPWFWDKLRYALPHSKYHKHKLSNKLNNLMNNIDKIDLVKTPITPNNESTPPVILDPLLLKKQPFEFKITNPVIC